MDLKGNDTGLNTQAMSLIVSDRKQKGVLNAFLANIILSTQNCWVAEFVYIYNHVIL